MNKISPFAKYGRVLHLSLYFSSLFPSEPPAKDAKNHPAVQSKNTPIENSIMSFPPLRK